MDQRQSEGRSYSRWLVLYDELCHRPRFALFSFSLFQFHFALPLSAFYNSVTTLRVRANIADVIFCSSVFAGSAVRY
jgi:hypothetical protein